MNYRMLVRYRGISSVRSSLIQFELFFPVIESETRIKTERSTWTFSEMLIYTISRAFWKFLYWNFYSEKKRKVGIYSISHTGSFLGAYHLFVLISNTDTH